MGGGQASLPILQVDAMWDGLALPFLAVLWQQGLLQWDSSSVQKEENPAQGPARAGLSVPCATL